MYVCMGVYSFRHSKLYLRDYCGHLYLLTVRSIPPGMTGSVDVISGSPARVSSVGFTPNHD